MQSSASWLTKLKAAELHRLAVLVGSPCSGTKLVITRGIQDALSLVPNLESQSNGRHVLHQDALRVLSIDMGIRNLAYSFWTTQAKTKVPVDYRNYERPILKAWNKVDISTSDAMTFQVGNVKDALRPRAADTILKTRETFEPIDYADRAYKLIKHLLHVHEPSHILIERQRFRSGGNASVQEWTIRVGVFEGMLYAVLRTLAASRADDHPFTVEPVLPARVNRYWFRDTPHSTAAEGPKESKSTSREVKRAKIELVQKGLREAMEHSQARLFELHDDVASSARIFVDKATSTGQSARKPQKRKPTENRATTSSISKLDDLSDSLLQGLAWMHWQDNRRELQTLKEKAFKLDVTH